MESRVLTDAERLKIFKKLLEELELYEVKEELFEIAVLSRVRYLKKQSDALTKLQAALKTLREV